MKSWECEKFTKKNMTSTKCYPIYVAIFILFRYFFNDNFNDDDVLSRTEEIHHTLFKSLDSPASMSTLYSCLRITRKKVTRQQDEKQSWMEDEAKWEVSEMSDVNLFAFLSTKIFPLLFFSPFSGFISWFLSTFLWFFYTFLPFFFFKKISKMREKKSRNNKKVGWNINWNLEWEIWKKNNFFFLWIRIRKILRIEKGFILFHHSNIRKIDFLLFFILSSFDWQKKLFDFVEIPCEKGFFFLCFFVHFFSILMMEKNNKWWSMTTSFIVVFFFLPLNFPSDENMRWTEKFSFLYFFHQ